ncbi:MAG: MipA/OmpV family protein [Asticcacaulis sp.]
MFKPALLSLSLLLLPATGLAQTQPFKPVEAQKDWTLIVGGGPVYGFSVSGKDPDRFNFTPWASFSYKDRLYANGLDGVGYNVVKRETVRAGVQIRPHYSGQSELEGLVLPDRGADLAVYGFVRVGESWSLGGRITHDISDVSDGSELFLSASRQDITKVGLLQTTLYSRAGNRKANQAYYGVELSEAAASGLRAYDLGGGVQNIGAAFLMMTPIGDKYAVGTLFNIERALGDVADSPLIERREHGEMAYRGGVIVVRRFGG